MSEVESDCVRATCNLHVYDNCFNSQAPLRARNDPDYVPNIFEFTKRTEAEDTKKKAGYERLQNRRNRATESNVSAVISLQIAANVGVQTDPTVLNGCSYTDGTAD